MTPFGYTKPGPKKSEKPQEYREYHAADEEYRRDHAEYMRRGTNWQRLLEIQEHRVRLFRKGQEEVTRIKAIIEQT